MRNILSIILLSLVSLGLRAGDIHVIPYPVQVEMQRGTVRLPLSAPERCRIDAGMAHADEYRLTLSRKGVDIVAQSTAGLQYARETLAQLRAQYGEELPALTVTDYPRYEWRGLMLDCSRHFYSLEYLKKQVDMLAHYKMNRLHLHLTDDQGWRIEIAKYPRLTEVGAYRKGTQIAKDRTSNDGVRYGGYYTRSQIDEIIAYADKLGITIVPEIDLPGHMQAALAAYPELGCAGSEPQPYEVWCRWGISKQVLSVGKEETMRFLEDVVGEVADIFPSEYFHIGGDECPRDEWQKDPACKAKIKELGLVSDSEASAEDRLQNYVTNRIQKYLSGKGKRVIGWDEVLKGELGEGATVMSWRGSKGGIEAAKKGFDVIMTANKFMYFDYYQLQDKDIQPLAIGGYLPFSKVYSFDPTEGLNASEAKFIKGVQANLWTEYVATGEHLEYMMLPRAIALSEVQWCQPSRKDLERAKSSMAEHQSRILDILGYNYCKTIE